jgi:hypothetical protein
MHEGKLVSLFVIKIKKKKGTRLGSVFNQLRYLSYVF